ncbi:MAG: hypothetical protein ACOY4R_27585 [Pseudomonadota bacterium]
MTPSTLLREIGEALHGSDRWRRPLGAQIGRDERTVYRYERGVSPIPADVWQALRPHLEARRAELGKLLERL